MKYLLKTCTLFFALALSISTYAYGPGDRHDNNRGRGHDHHQGNGYGHHKDKKHHAAPELNSATAPIALLLLGCLVAIGIERRRATRLAPINRGE